MEGGVGRPRWEPPVCHPAHGFNEGKEPCGEEASEENPSRQTLASRSSDGRSGRGVGGEAGGVWGGVT